MAPVKHTTGVSRNHSLSSSTSAAGSIRLGTFQSRGLLTKIGSGGSGAGTTGGYGAGGLGGGGSSSLRGSGALGSNVPRPVNTSSLRKENGGQDITAVLVNRHGGKKVGWGSSLAETKEKVETATETNTNTTPSNDTEVAQRNHVEPTRASRPGSRSLDPTPEEAMASAKKSDPDSKMQQQPPPLNSASDQNAPWAFHQPAQPPPPPSRDSMSPHNSEFPPSIRDRDYPEPGREDPHSRRGSSNGYNNYHRDQQYNSRHHRDSGSYDQPYHRGGYESNYHSRRFDRGNSPPSDRFDSDYNRGGRRDYGYNDGAPPSRRYDDRGERGGRDDDYGGYNRGGYNRSRYNDGYSRDRYPRNDDRYYDRRGGDGYYGRGDYGDDRGAYSRYREDRKYPPARMDDDNGGSRDERYPRYDRYGSGRDRHATGDELGEKADYRSTSREENEQRRVKRHTWSEDDLKDDEGVDTTMDQQHFDNSTSSPNREDSETQEVGPVDNDEHHVEPKRILKHETASNTGDADLDSSLTLDKKTTNASAVIANEPECVVGSTTSPTLVSLEENEGGDQRKIIESETSDDIQDDDKDEDDVSYASSGADHSIDEQNNNIKAEEPTREQIILQQQQNILRQVHATRLEKARSSSFADDVEKIASNTAKNDPTVTATNNSPTKVKESEQYEENDTSATMREEALRSKEEFLAKRAAERAARASHRLTRKPRTRGVLFKRLEDGTIVNADLSAEELTKREERRLKKEAQKLAKSNKSHKHDASRRSRNVTNYDQNNNDKANDSNDCKSNGSNEAEKKESKPLMPSPGPSVSAWVAGPPPGMVKRQEQSKELSVNTTGKSSTNMIEEDDEATKLDKVLSSSLLDIGNNGTSWSSPSSTKPKTSAVGPIMSSWSEFAGNPAGFDYQSFGDAKAENKLDSTPVNGADWTSPLPDYENALPRDLLSNGADSEDEISNAPIETNKKEQSNNKNRHQKNRTPYRGKKTQNSSGPGQNKKRHPRSNDGKKQRGPKAKKTNKESE